MQILKQSPRRSLNRGFQLFIAVLLIATIAPQILGIKTTFADDGGYPWIDATCVDGTDCSSTYNWGYTLNNGQCPSNDTNCLSYPYPANPPYSAGMGDTWGYGVRNCTSYVAWKINQVFPGTDLSGLGNASTWDNNYSPSSAVKDPATYTPVVGDIAQWDTPAPEGHVAYVTAVNGTTATLAEYNSGLPKDAQGHLQWGLFYNGRTTATNSAGTPSHYIHIGSLTSSNGVVWGLNSVGHVYRWDGSSWVLELGTLTNVSVGTSSSGAEYVWGVNSSGVVFKWNGSSWDAMPGTLTQVAVGSNGVVWGINSSGGVFRWNGSSWDAKPGVLTNISVGTSAGSEYVWGVNSSGVVFKWNGSGWTTMPGTLTQVAVGGSGVVWGVNSASHAYRWNGSSWVLAPGTLTNVSAGTSSGSEYVWGVNASSVVFKWNGSGWDTMSGVLTQVAVGDL